MKKILVITAIIALAPLVAAPAAEAGIFSVGVAFNVGGLFFDLGFGGPRYSAHASHHVYRVAEPFYYAGYECHSGCYRDAGYYYHHADCPVVAYHFRSHGFSPYAAYPTFFAPPAYGHYSGYRSYGSTYRHYRPYTYRDHHYHGRRGFRDHRGHHERYRGDHHRGRGVRDPHRGHLRRDLRDPRHRGDRDRSHVDRSDRRREETRGGDRRGGSRRRDGGSTRSRDRRGARP